MLILLRWKYRKYLPKLLRPNVSEAVELIYDALRNNPEAWTQFTHRLVLGNNEFKYKLAIWTANKRYGMHVDLGGSSLVHEGDKLELSLAEKAVLHSLTSKFINVQTKIRVLKALTNT